METLSKQQTGIDKAYELKDKANEWVERSFNYIQLSVVEKYADNMLYEYIRQVASICDAESYFDALSKDEQEELNTEYKEEHDEALDFYQWLCEAHKSAIIDYSLECGNENYPMWGTLFEFRENPSKEVIQAAIEAGFGIIEGLDDFNPLLFVTGCGYSYYGHHWIPMYLNLPWNDKEREHYKGIEYDMM